MVTKGFWLVGITFRSPQERLVQHFYVIPGAPDAEAARKAALSRARMPAECALRGGLGVESATAVETREVLRDAIGVWTLADRDTTAGETPDVQTPGPISWRAG
ncbi:hypothetical protein AB0N88_04920 [Streptomyces sp. NPDC093516]|uniref:hypothetical protein n=1 Tax=Streptomyces sp. NPDC093516 TaxID=3155304 RepID=UPI0034323EDF